MIYMLLIIEIHRQLCQFTLCRLAVVKELIVAEWLPSMRLGKSCPQLDWYVLLYFFYGQYEREIVIG